MSGTVATLEAPRLRWRRYAAWVRLAGPSGWILGTLLVCALIAPAIVPYSPIEAIPSDRLQPPSSAHLFGTDSLGMDVFSRVLYATRWDLSISVLGIVGAMIVGTPVGGFAAYAGGRLDEVLSRLSEVGQSFPVVLFALMIFAALGNSGQVLVGIIAFVYAPVFFKLTRSVVLPLKEADFVLAARCSGLSTAKIVRRHILLNALGPLAGQFAIMCAYALQVVAGLSFLGLGVPVPYPEWGAMIQDGAGRVITGDWWPSVFPGLAILAAVIAFQGVGRTIRARYDA